MDQASIKNEPLLVTRANCKDIVIISKSDYTSMVETCYLLGRSKNTERILNALKELDEGKGLEKDLIE